VIFANLIIDTHDEGAVGIPLANGYTKLGIFVSTEKYNAAIDAAEPTGR
jgi:hypothetical protein